MRFSESQHAISWLSQFQDDDHEIAKELVDSITFVSYNDFFKNLSDMIRQCAEEIEGLIGLYAEREIKKWKGKPNRLFKEQRRKKVRAYGVGPQPVSPTTRYNPNVGSEGLVAQLVSEIVTDSPEKYLNHPGPDLIRQKKMRAFFLVTDFIGSGKRVNEYLDSVWRIFSVKSWKSFGLVKFIVVAYSATDIGKETVEKHPSRPEVKLLLPCPTVCTEFTSPTPIIDICMKYDPLGADEIESLGFSGVGSLIVFAHGCPNNSPRIFYKTSSKKNAQQWDPLFPARNTWVVRSEIESFEPFSILQRMNRLKDSILAEEGWESYTSADGRSLLLVLTAVRRSPRYDDVISRKIGLTIPEVRHLVSFASEMGLINSNRQLTDRGQQELRHARQFAARLQKKQKNELEFDEKTYYYPTKLRTPR